ncbi:PEGA domain-containing protein [Anaeromyxobacter oryzae]|uniref:PEGA domain-containing protein n=1 Tax=Anaeromyxobacter oryzae TaxID=2918170 RepID=A0ABN6MQP3_9BACT|nr:PEGA domain-containing protein [Anaeromyxobacter oryzae]BDG03332.1 hypothetical protein AMOR_23280 [Anaeromyxobacter oryzae]
MIGRAVAVVAALLVAGEGAAVERLGVMAVGDPPGGPDPDVTELAHQLRAMCRDRVGGVEEVSTMRARLLGQESGATLSELDRAYGGALAVYQSGEFESAYRTLKAIIADLEMLPESDEAYEQWVRALLRLAHAALTLGSQKDMDAALLKLARTDLTVLPDPDQYSPSYRRRFEELKARVRALPRRRLVVTAEGHDGTVFVNGRKMGTTPLALSIPAGTYRIGGASGALRVPTFPVDLEGEDRAVVLDFALADALRVNAGPGLALAPAQRAYGIIRAGAWLGLDRLVVVSRVEEGQAQFLLGSMYDVRRGALLREGSVRMVAGSVPSVNLGALAAFLLTGQNSREVKDRTQDGPREIVPPAVASEAPSRVPPVVTTTPLPQVPPVTASPGSTRAAAQTRPLAATTSSSSSEAPSPRPSPSARAGGEGGLSPIPTATPTVATRTLAATAGAATTASPSPAAPLAAGAGAGTAPGAHPPLTATLATPAATTAFAPPPADLGPRRPTSRHPWMRPAAIGVGIVAVGLAGVAVQQGLTASQSYADARAMLQPDLSLKPGSDGARYQALRDDGGAATRNMYVSAGAAVLLAGAAGVLGWWSFDVDPATGGTLALRF